MASKDSGKGVSLAKRAKISKAEQNMFVAVCLASILLGVTLVGVYQLVMTIQFNGKVLAETAKIRDDTKTYQDNITALKGNIRDLARNENLESVGRENPECVGYVAPNPENESEEAAEDITKTRTCSALRVVGDALPSLTSMNDFEGTLNSFIKLLVHDDNAVNIETINLNDNLEYVVKVDGDGNATGESGDGTESSDGSEDGSEAKKLNINAMGISINARDSATKIKKMMSSVEDSIRNYDIRNVTITWSEQEIGESGQLESIIDLNATYSAYYSSSVEAYTKSKTICADDENEKCSKANTPSEEGQ